MVWYRNRGLSYFLGMLMVSVVGVGLTVLTRASITSDCASPLCLMVRLNSKEKSSKQIEQIAREITVRISSGGSKQEFIGSGTIIRDNSAKGYKYRVITNSHVLRGGDGPYNIHTGDGKVYRAKVSLFHPKFEDDDIAILRFDGGTRVYKGGKINRGKLDVEQKVFVGGFISEKEGIYNFKFTSGKISLVLDKPLVGGYEIAYTNTVERGMSGAPLLNIYGEVVGINGLSGDPLWKTHDLYQDGKNLEPELEKIVLSSSMAVRMRGEWGK
ncbi:peptidase S1 and S6 chymotrypsin/Hap [Raphidiopsis curvata NIES-932]|nr:peptidase S1 and S6 chymotrypsin/Hap [Raphidiopsis curvata NIES-932]